MTTNSNERQVYRVTHWLVSPMRPSCGNRRGSMGVFSEEFDLEPEPDRCRKCNAKRASILARKAKNAAKAAIGGAS